MAEEQAVSEDQLIEKPTEISSETKVEEVSPEGVQEPVVPRKLYVQQQREVSKRELEIQRLKGLVEQQGLYSERLAKLEEQQALMLDALYQAPAPEATSPPQSFTEKLKAEREKVQLKPPPELTPEARRAEEKFHEIREILAEEGISPNDSKIEHIRETFQSGNFRKAIKMAEVFVEKIREDEAKRVEAENERKASFKMISQAPTAGTKRIFKESENEAYLEDPNISPQERRVRAQEISKAFSEGRVKIGE